MLTQPDDSGELTSFGRLSGQLPVDLQLGRLVAYGIALGIGPEAVVLAASLSQPKSLFRIASPMVHTDPNEYNAIVQQTFLGCVELDNGAYSEPIMYLNMYIQWQAMTDMNEREAWLAKHGVVRSRIRQFASVAKHLQERVNDALRFAGDFRGHDSHRPSTTATGTATGAGAIGGPGSSQKDGRGSGRFQRSSHRSQKQSSASSMIAVGSDTGTLIPPLTAKTLNCLRLILTWTSEGNVIRQKVKETKSADDFTTVRMTPELSSEHLEILFPKSVNWRLENKGRRHYDATLSTERRSTKIADLMRDLAMAAVGSASEQRAAVAWLVQQQQLLLPPSQLANEQGGKKGSDKRNNSKGKNNKASSSSSSSAAKSKNKGNGHDDDDDAGSGGDSFVVMAVDPTFGQSHFNFIREIFKGNKLLLAGQFQISVPVDRRVNVEQPAGNGTGNGSGLANSARKKKGSESTSTIAATATTATGGGDVAQVALDMYIIDSPSTRELRSLRKLHDSLPVSISMLIPTIGNAKVIASNCIPKRSQLCKLFFGEYTSYDEMLAYNTGNSGGGVSGGGGGGQEKGGGGGGGEREKKSDRHIAEQVLASTQRIVFPHSSLLPSSAAATANGRATAAATSSGGLQASGYGGSASSSAFPSLIADVPLGIRLLNSYRNGYRDR
jgi:hypothetical protein